VHDEGVDDAADAAGEETEQQVDDETLVRATFHVNSDRREEDAEDDLQSTHIIPSG
jgi:hypothetical protein